MAAPSPSVLVVGAGPVGLAAALELGRLGARIRVVELRSQATQESRAVAVNPRTLDLMEPSGATERLLAAGVRIRGMRLFAGGHSFGTIDLSHLDHRFPFMLSLPQNETERILGEMVEAIGIRIERGVAVTGIETNEAEAFASFGEGAGSRERFDWIVGADGAHSMVRKAIGASFPGERYPFEWSLADLELTGDVEEDRGEAHIDVGRPLLFRLPIGHGLHRLIANGADVLSLAPPSWRPGAVHWASSFSVSHRQADRVRQGRALIIGDAAHIHSPAGGRGMNLGIEDAATLAPRIMAGELGDWPEARRAAAAKVVRESDQLQRFATSDNATMRRLIPVLGRMLLPIPAVQQWLVHRITGLPARTTTGSGQ